MKFPLMSRRNCSCRVCSDCAVEQLTQLLHRGMYTLNIITLQNLQNVIRLNADSEQLCVSIVYLVESCLLNKHWQCPSFLPTAGIDLHPVIEGAEV